MEIILGGDPSSLPPVEEEGEEFIVEIEVVEPEVLIDEPFVGGDEESLAPVEDAEPEAEKSSFSFSDIVAAAVK